MFSASGLRDGSCDDRSIGFGKGEGVPHFVASRSATVLQHGSVNAALSAVLAAVDFDTADVALAT